MWASVGADPIQNWTPIYEGEIQDEDGTCYLRLENLTINYEDAYVVDCKLGTRTFLENEASNRNLRADLY